MNQLIGYYGMDCGTCEARKATLENNDALRAKVAADWSKLNNCEIKPEWINCEGCRAQGVKTVYCEQMCAICPCALGKGYETCHECAEKERCPQLAVMKNEV